MSSRLAHTLADLVMLTHFGFVLFVGVGALLVLRWRRVAWAHVPCAAYGVAIEFFGWVCPLTPLEQDLRRLSGSGGYTGGFTEHYVGGLLYPSNWWILARERTPSGARSATDPDSPKTL